MKEQKAKLSYEIYTKNNSFFRLFCNALKFYGRVTSICYSHNPRLGRGAKSLNLATQAMLTAAVVSLFGLFRKDSEDWTLGAGDLILIFLLMRVV